MSEEKMYIKWKKFLNFCENSNIKADFYYLSHNDKEVLIRVVPFDYDIYEIPQFKNYCKMIGFNCENEFFSDEEVTHGYRDYHDCKLTDNGTLFNKKKLIEEVLNEED